MGCNLGVVYSDGAKLPSYVLVCKAMGEHSQAWHLLEEVCFFLCMIEAFCW